MGIGGVARPEVRHVNNGVILNGQVVATAAECLNEVDYSVRRTSKLPAIYDHIVRLATYEID